MPELTQGLTWPAREDRGYISQQLFKVLWAQGLQLITKIRKNMPNELMPLADKLLLSQACHHRNHQRPDQQHPAGRAHPAPQPRQCHNNILAALVAYTHQPCKPSPHLSKPT